MRQRGRLRRARRAGGELNVDRAVQLQQSGCSARRVVWPVHQTADRVERAGASGLGIRHVMTVVDTPGGLQSTWFAIGKSWCQLPQHADNGYFELVGADQRAALTLFSAYSSSGHAVFGSD